MRALAAGRILPLSRVHEMVSTAALPAGFTPPYGYGLSTAMGRRAAGVVARRRWRRVGRDGRPIYPDDKLTVVVFGNRGWLWSTDLGVPIVRALLGQPEPPALRRAAINDQERNELASFCDDGLFDFKIGARQRDVRVTVAPFGEPIELWESRRRERSSRALRPDTFRLTLRDGSPPEFDWMEHRSYLRPCAEPSKTNV